MQTAVDEARGYIHHAGPRDRVCTYQRNVVLRQHRDKLRDREALVADLHRMLKRSVFSWIGQGAALHFLAVSARQSGRFLGGVRKQTKKVIDDLRLEAKAWRELPK